MRLRLGVAVRPAGTWDRIAGATIAALLAGGHLLGSLVSESVISVRPW